MLTSFTTATERGMSLLETLLVVALLGLLASTVFVMLPTGGETDATLAVEQLHADLASMRSRARSGEEHAAFGVAIATSSYTGFKVVGVATTTLLTTSFPSGVTITPTVVIFKAISGASNPLTLTIMTTNATRTLEITASGAIK